MEEELYKTEADWFNYSEEDLEFVRDLAEMGKYPKKGVKLIEESIRLRKLGNISEAVELLKLEFDEMKKWRNERRAAMRKINSSAINFDETDCDDIDFSETEKSENSTLEEWQEKEKERIESLENAVERKLEK